MLVVLCGFREPAHKYNQFVILHTAYNESNLINRNQQTEKQFLPKSCRLCYSSPPLNTASLLDLYSVVFACLCSMRENLTKKNVTVLLV